MLRVLFDKNVPYPLRRYLVGCNVITAEEEGWGQISNGELISRAEEAGYQLLLTCDQNVRTQQDISQRKISILVLGSNIWPSVEAKIPEINGALRTISPGSVAFIEIAPPPKQRRLLRPDST